MTDGPLPRGWTARCATRTISVEREDPNSPDACRLMAELAAEEARRYAELGADPHVFRASEFLLPGGAFLVARLEGEAVGCGGIRRIDGTTAELKRMYVAPPARGRGVGRRLLSELERIAAACGYRLVRLETGNRQPEAIALYRGEGYTPIAPFGEHAGDPVSLCFEKRL